MVKKGNGQKKVTTLLKIAEKRFQISSSSLVHWSVIWYGAVAVPVVDVNGSFAAIVQLKHVSVSMVSPPGAQLAVPATSQRIKQFRMLHANHGEEVLVPEVAPEAVLVG